MMEISKVFNNNCVATIIDGVEYVITGSGIGFQMKAGDVLDENKIEKKFSFMDDTINEFEKLLNNIPLDYFESTRAIVEYAFHKYNITLNDGINITLTDHISYAVLRAREGIQMPSLFRDELKMFYPEEYEIADWGLKFLNKKYDVELPIDEIGYIAVHVVNSRDGNQSYQAQNMIFFLKEVIEIISEDLDVVIDKDSRDYTRLTTHLKYLAYRVFGESQSLDSGGNEVAQLVSSKLSKYNNCVAKIASFILQRFDYHLSLDERMYLSIHIYQIMQSIARV